MNRSNGFAVFGELGHYFSAISSVFGGVENYLCWWMKLCDGLGFNVGCLLCCQHSRQNEPRTLVHGPRNQWSSPNSDAAPRKSAHITALWVGLCYLLAKGCFWIDQNILERVQNQENVFLTINPRSWNVSHLKTVGKRRRREEAGRLLKNCYFFQCNATFFRIVVCWY